MLLRPYVSLSEQAVGVFPTCFICPSLHYCASVRPALSVRFGKLVASCGTGMRHDPRARLVRGIIDVFDRTLEFAERRQRLYRLELFHD